ncbi:MAG: hypothetical protein Q7N50_04750 [Armatimonadota bacterium]|nr:hypothetical protein [Armatimonadota bacterium]
MKHKTQIYLIVFSLIISGVVTAAMWLSLGGTETDSQKAMTQAQRLKVLEKVAPQSPAMSGFLQNEKAKREADNELTGGSGR